MLRGFLGNDRGNMTMIMGIASIPVIAAAGMAIDYARISRVHDEIQLIADGATLAAAGARNLTGTFEQRKSQRVNIATNFVTDGLSRLTDIEEIGTPVIVATNSKVTVEVNASVKGSLINVLDVGKRSDANTGDGGGGNQDGSSAKGRVYDMTINSEASWNEGASFLCMLVLDPTAAQALEIQGTADLFAPGCAVWVNSNSNSGLYENGNATLTAKKICVRGNYVGNKYYYDAPKTGSTDCPLFVDPLATKFAEDYDDAYDDAADDGPLSCRNSIKCVYNGWQSTSRKYNPLSFTGSSVNQTIQPGIYDGGIEVKSGATVKLAAGTYFIQNGEFRVTQANVMNADAGGVTIVFTEPNGGTNTNSKTRLYVNAQSTLTLKAPASGPFAGIAVAQHPNSRTPNHKNDANTVIGGGNKNITGIVYYPTNYFYITGGGTGTTASPEEIAVDDPLFAIVANRVFIEGNGQLKIGGSSDNESAGLPALPTAGQGEAYVSLR